ncbi:hypothetical protein [Pseudomonas syringae]|uniref:Uncharacterized protein n=1 Tax=Pseudomonas syringae TaxID=317 RepID=A0A085V3T4_PSESX|nr:hypothetical protein [Pseudomonas syringae]KFE50097.1 hypothetical protein IV01_25775 [Pseudomonas syringae]
MNQPKTHGAMVRRVCHACVGRPRSEHCGICDPAEQTLAVGGEPEVLACASFAKNGNIQCWSLTRDHASLRKLEGEGHRVIELIDRAQVAPLLADIERLDAELDERADWDQRQLVVIRQLNDCIAELKAQQGEPVACATIQVEIPSGKVLPAATVARFDIEQLPVGSLLNVYLQAQPATAKVVLPPRKEPSADSPYLSDMDYEYNALLDEISRLNP